jgi:hypothetical protein
MTGFAVAATKVCFSGYHFTGKERASQKTSSRFADNFPSLAHNDQESIKRPLLGAAALPLWPLNFEKSPENSHSNLLNPFRISKK